MRDLKTVSSSLLRRLWPEREVKDIGTFVLALKMILALMWPMSAAAAQASFGASIVSMSLLSISVTLLLSTLSGLTSLLRQMLKDLKHKKRIDHMGLYVASNLLASNTVGLLALFMSEGRFDHNYQAGVIIVASFGGAVVLERGVQGLLGVAEQVITGKGRD
jgi:hypothetical protein